MKGMNVKRQRLLLTLLAAALLLGGCRVRTTPDLPAGQEGRQAGIPAGREQQPEGNADVTDMADSEPEVSDSGERSQDNPEANRKEYDETADTEIIPGAAHIAAEEGTGEAAGTGTAEADRRESLLDEAAEKSATRIISAGEAERMGVAEDAKSAETAADYYRVLLQDRLGTLMECQRLYIYWETETEWRTVYRTSPEHRIIMDSGCYDVSARLTEERLQVDAGWVVRKNPDMIVRVVPAGVLGSGVYSADEARQWRDGMFRREGWNGIPAVRTGRVALIAREMTEAPHMKLAAELLIAQTAYPELFGDVDVGEALKAMTEEATGSIPESLFFYNGRE